MNQNARSKWLEQSNVIFDFHVYFWNQYGQRWKNLFASLGDLHEVVGFCNPFVEYSNIQKQGLDKFLGVKQSKPLDQFSSLKVAVGVSRHDKIVKDSVTNLKPYYWIDPASFIPPLLLDVNQSHRVLDMCAAPGGKSLIIASLMFGDQYKRSIFANRNRHFYRENLFNSQICDSMHQNLNGTQGFNLNQTKPQQVCEEQQQYDPRNNSIKDNNNIHFDGIYLSYFKIHHSDTCSKNLFSTNGAQRNFNKCSEIYTNKVSNTENILTQQDITFTQNYLIEDISSFNFCMQDSFNKIDESQQISGHLICNEIDSLRSSRMERILRENLPYYGCLDKFISIGRKDGGRYWSRFEQETFDRVLLDVPCTSERHVAQRAARERWGSIADDHWSLQMCGERVKLQEALLYAGIRCLKKGGKLVYSTCSLDKAQNDGVVKKVIGDFYKQQVRLVNVDSSLAKSFSAEVTDLGVMVLPDKSGFGPLYICVLQKY